MAQLTIKSQYYNTVIAFNNSGVRLHKRSQQDLIDLAIMAHRSQNPSLLILFDSLPPLDKLLSMKMGKVIEAVTEQVPYVEKQSETKPGKIKKRHTKKAETK